MTLKFVTSGTQLKPKLYQNRKCLKFIYNVIVVVLTPLVLTCATIALGACKWPLPDSRQLTNGHVFCL